ncbi:MAG: lactate utilization protein [Desulfobacteraceae bacterium]|nr:lactate utilization protein [Desulfobacteraceae bacterium]
MSGNKELYELFREKAEAVSAKVSTIKTLPEAFLYAADLIVNSDNCDAIKDKTITAPGLGDDDFAKLEEICSEKGIKTIRTGLLDNTSGIDVGVTGADYGIAETGTLVVDSKSEDLRLATMISNIHVAILPESKIRATAFDLTAEMNELLEESAGYMAFITGPSRTADIERILALGVHGPLELHILVQEGN